MRIRSQLALPLIAAAAAAFTPTVAQARGLTVTVPKSITELRSFAVTWEGDTGPGDLSGGSFIVENRIQKGKKACPANAEFKIGGGATGAGAQNVFHAGSFRGADQAWLGDSGTHRICGYVTTNAESGLTYELLYTKLIKVKALPRRAKLQLKAAPLKDGTYTATAADILGGTPTSTLTFVVQGQKVASVSATGIPTTGCLTGFRTQTPVLDTATSTTAETTSNSVIGQGFTARFVIAPPSGSLWLDAAAKSSKEIRGVLSGDSSDGSCRGGFGFIAKRS